METSYRKTLDFSFFSKKFVFAFNLLVVISFLVYGHVRGGFRNAWDISQIQFEIAHLDFSRYDLNEKIENCKWIFFRAFLKINFLGKKLVFRPRFSDMVREIELKLFLHILVTIWGGYFFLFQKILYWWVLAAFTKTALVKKQQFFRVHRVFWLFYRKDKRYKETKKSTHPKQYPVPAKKVSTQSNIGPLRNGGEKLGHFYRLRPQYLIQDSIWELWV